MKARRVIWVVVSPKGKIVHVDFRRRGLVSAETAAGWEEVRTGEKHRVVSHEVEVWL